MVCYHGRHVCVGNFYHGSGETMNIKTLLKKKEQDTTIKREDDIKALVEVDEGLVNCMIYVEATKSRIYRQVDHKLIPKEAVERNYKGQPYYMLGLDEKGFWPIERENKVSAADSPQSLMIVLEKFNLLIAKAFPMGSQMIEKVKITILIVFSFIELIVIFLILGSIG